jgi:hypothetical protein
MQARAPLAAIAILAGAAVTAAAPYPTAVCVGAKQLAAARYCRSALSALAAHEVWQNDARRDRAVARALGRLESAWSSADARAAVAGVDCADTTGSAAGLAAVVDAAAGDLVAAVNATLDLGNAAHARCGKRLVQAAGMHCLRVLRARGGHVGDLEADASRAVLERKVSAATTRLERVIGRLAGCPAAALPGLGTLAAGVSGAAVFHTLVSPSVPAAQFATYLPVGPIPYEGRDYHPVCKDGSPYAYFAKRGTVNKLLVYYQGGGACWENLTCSVGVCDPNVNPAGSDNPNNASTGFFDLGNPANPFRDWSIVFVPYCSCDIHFGDAAQDYAGPFPTIHVEHRGYQNSRVVERFAREHFVEPDEIFVTGSSAGAYGAWFHAPLHRLAWPSSKMAVLADAGNGVVTQSFLETNFPNWNFAANVPTDIPGLTDTLTNGTGIPGYTEIVADYFPDIRWAHYTTAFDGGLGGQTGFYNIMLNDNDPIAATTWWNGSCPFNAAMRAQAQATYAAVPSNYRYYIGTGSRHTMWGSNKVYGDVTGGVPTIVDWVNALIGGTPDWVNVEAANQGLLLPGDPRPPTIPTPPFQQVGSDVVVVCDP